MDLRERFRDLWQRVKAKGDPDKVFDQISAYYSQAHRFYHTLEHIRFCLELLDQFKGVVDDFDALEWAIWFHDLVYNIPGPDNEARSAEFAMQTARYADLDEDFALRVGRYIMITKGHKVGKKAPLEEKIVCDIDLAILGQASEVYDQYERNIWREFGTVYPRQAYCKGRSSFLDEIGRSKKIFLTPLFKKRFDCAAKANLARTMEAFRVEMLTL